MTTESHKSVAIELPTYKVLKKVAEDEFRSPSKQIAYMLNKHYPDLFQSVEQEEEDNALKKVEHRLISDDSRSMYRTWQLVICLWKNRALCPLSQTQVLSSISYKYGNPHTLVTRPIGSGLVERTSDDCFQLTAFGKFVAGELNENVPVRLTEVILDQARKRYRRSIDV